MFKSILSIIVAITPIFFWTLTPNFFHTSKQLLFTSLLLIWLVFIALRSFQQKNLELSLSPLRFGLYAFALAIILNLILNPIARIESIYGPVLTYLSLCLFSYLLTIYGNRSFRPIFVASLLSATSVLSLHTILQLTTLYQVQFLPAYMHSRGFTLTGSLLTTLTLIIIGSVVALYLSLKQPKFRTWTAIITALHTVAIVALSISLLPGGELALQILPFNASWNIALDAMKNLKSLFFGVGLTQFSSFFKSVKPLFLNTNNYWNLLPTSSSSTLLDLMTTTGLLGIVSFLSLPLLIINLKRDDFFYHLIQLIALISGLALIITPTSFLVLLIFFASLGFLGYKESSVRVLAKATRVIFPLSLLGLVAYVSFGGYLLVKSEFNMRLAQNALANQDGKKVYEYHLSAIKHLPKMTSYRLSYSQVNLSLASSLSQKNSQLSDPDRQNISKLISQAVREAKFAASLTPNNSTVWQNLGLVYRNLINVAEGADKFAIDSYAQAVALDPANPALRVEFGGLLYQLGSAAKKSEDQSKLYARAQSEFQTAIQLKPDYPNAYYNLAKLLESQGDYQNAVLSLQKSISLLGPDSLDLGKANSELLELQAKLKKPLPTPSGAPVSQTSDKNPSLVEPSPLPSPLAGGPVELP